MIPNLLSRVSRRRCAELFATSSPTFSLRRHRRRSPSGSSTSVRVRSEGLRGYPWKILLSPRRRLLLPLGVLLTLVILLLQVLMLVLIKHRAEQRPLAQPPCRLYRPWQQ